MAIIDYHLVQNGLYAKLSPSSRILIPVLSTLCDNYTGEIPAKQAKASYLALKAGLTSKSVRAALKELAKDQYKIVALEMGSGRISSIQYRPVVRLAKQNSTKQVTSTALPSKPVTITEQTGNHYRFNSDLFLSETPPESAETQPSPNLASDLLFLNNRFKLTTTDLPVPKMLIKAMISRHGSEVVVKVISGMEKKFAAGEEIDNPGAYFRKCCLNGWEPSSKAIQEKEKLAERKAREKERQEKQDQDRQAMAAQIEEERNDPERMARVAAIQAEFWKNFDSTATQEAAG